MIFNVDAHLEDADWPKRTNDKGRAKAGLVARATALRDAIAAPNLRAVAAADEHAPAIEAAAMLAFARARRELPDTAAALETLGRELTKLVEPPLRRAQRAGWEAGAEALGVTGIRVAKRPARGETPIKFTAVLSFGDADQNILDWAARRAGELVTSVLETTRDAIRETIAALWETNKEVALDEAAAHAAIAKAVGDASRAQLIARTESMIAANAGQRQAWTAAAEAGWLPPNMRRVWIVTEDDRLCPQCAPLDGVTAELGGEFAPGITGAPLHPNCRCTEGLQ